MLTQKDNPRDWPVKLKQEMEEWLYKAFEGMKWYIDDLRRNTDATRLEIKELKEKMSENN